MKKNGIGIGSAFIFTLVLMLVLSACKHTTEGETSPYIDGYVIDDPGGAPVPFAYVTVGKEIDDGSWITTFEMTDTLRADSLGHFQLDRYKYKNLFNECICSFVACGTGPDTPEGADFYENTCYKTSFDPLTTQQFWCSAKTQGYLRVFVTDIEPFNIDFESVGVNIQTIVGDDGVEFFPNPEFDPEIGAIFGPFPNGGEIETNLLFVQGGTILSSLIQTQTNNIIGKDTTTIFFQY